MVARKKKRIVVQTVGGLQAIISKTDCEGEYPIKGLLNLGGLLKSVKWTKDGVISLGIEAFNIKVVKKK